MRSSQFSKIVPALLVLLGGLLTASAASAAETLVVEGTGDSQALLRAIAEEFNAEHAGTYSVEVPDSIGSSGGVQAVIMERTPLARVARPLKDKEKAEGVDYIQFATSPVVFSVNPAVEGVEDVAASDLIGIYRGDITNWRELGGPDAEIFVVDREPGDSSRSVLAETIPGFDEIEVRQAHVFFTTPETVEALQTHDYAIGYTPLAMVEKTKLRILSLDGAFPEAESIRTDAYPHVVKLGFAFKPPLDGAAEEFVEFVGGETGQRIIKEFGAVPVRPSL